LYAHQNKLFSQQIRAAGEEFTCLHKNKKEPEMYLDVFHDTSQPETLRLELTHRTTVPNPEKKCNLMY
jgi:hypothetical protein